LVHQQFVQLRTINVPGALAVDAVERIFEFVDKLGREPRCDVWVIVDQLEKAFEPRRAVFRALAFESVR
jgi:hypothetical protein